MSTTSRPTKAVILAAGMGNRVGGAARGLPKPLLPVAGTPILHRALRCLAHAGVRDVVIVVGHRSEEIMRSLPERRFSSDVGEDLAVTFVVSDRYETTNNIYSLWLARDHLDQDVYLLDGDTLFDVELLLTLSDLPAQGAAGVVPHQWGMTGTIVELDSEDRVITMFDIRGDDPPSDTLYKTVSLFVLRLGLLRDVFVPTLERFVQGGRVCEYWEAVLTEIVASGWRGLSAADCSRFRWGEVDDVADWMKADVDFSAPDERFDLINNEYGRYQRSGAADHLVMTNIYFPTEPMRRDLRRELDLLLTDYPSSQRTLARLLAGVVDQLPERLVVANGASELIGIICGSVAGRVVVPVPTFNEYEHAVHPQHLVRCHLEPPGFRLDVERLYDVAIVADAELVVVVSPNNPTSLAVPRNELIWLCEKLACGGILLLVDESFVDFCADPLAQSLADGVGAHQNLAIIKSLSMSCGVPGLRLGYLLTGNESLAASVRRQVPIWNVNAVAEAFLRLLPRYKADLAGSCARVRRECDELHALLSAIADVAVCPPTASFCFARLPTNTNATAVARRLLDEHNILVKSCSGKSMPEGQSYLRVKSRTCAENQYLARALADVLDRTAVTNQALMPCR